eukprot:Skav230692  [mRNA]  locus=scaffold2202:317735:322722:- [translate_table: standard]
MDVDYEDDAVEVRPCGLRVDFLLSRALSSLAKRWRSAWCAKFARSVDVDASSIRFVASQPWLFPRSLLLGFTAQATDERIDFDAEELEAMGPGCLGRAAPEGLGVAECLKLFRETKHV